MDTHAHVRVCVEHGFDVDTMYKYMCTHVPVSTHECSTLRVCVCTCMCCITCKIISRLNVRESQLLKRKEITNILYKNQCWGIHVYGTCVCIGIDVEYWHSQCKHGTHVRGKGL